MKIVKTTRTYEKPKCKTILMETSSILAGSETEGKYEEIGDDEENLHGS